MSEVQVSCLFRVFPGLATRCLSPIFPAAVGLYRVQHHAGPGTYPPAACFLALHSPDRNELPGRNKQPRSSSSTSSRRRSSRGGGGGAGGGSGSNGSNSSSSSGSGSSSSSSSSSRAGLGILDARLRS